MRIFGDQSAVSDRMHTNFPAEALELRLQNAEGRLSDRCAGIVKLHSAVFEAFHDAVGVTEEDVAGARFGAVADVLQVAPDPFRDAPGRIHDAGETLVETGSNHGVVNAIANWSGPPLVVLAAFPEPGELL